MDMRYYFDIFIISSFAKIKKWKTGFFHFMFVF